MKKVLLLMLAITASAARAQNSTPLSTDSMAFKTNSMAVAPAATANFEKAHKGIVPTWTMDGENYMASFTDSLKMGHIITYDPEGVLLTTQVQQIKQNFPAPIEKYHRDHYAYEKYTVWLITDATGNKRYYFTRYPNTIWFDPSGKLLEKSRNKKVQ